MMVKPVERAIESMLESWTSTPSISPEELQQVNEPRRAISGGRHPPNIIRDTIYVVDAMRPLRAPPASGPATGSYGSRTRSWRGRFRNLT